MKKLIKYQCNSCDAVSQMTVGGWLIQCSCGGTLSETETNVVIPKTFHDSTELQSARKECKARKKSKSYVHILQCDSCMKCSIEKTYAKYKTCECEGTQWIRYSYDGSNREFDGETGELIVELRATARQSKLKDARELAGLTQQELASELGLSRVFISKVESGKAAMTAKLEGWMAEM
jgi:DNA-binding XRE family transcriptional regulator